MLETVIVSIWGRNCYSEYKMVLVKDRNQCVNKINKWDKIR